jgi:iron complex transport system permease protein
VVRAADRAYRVSLSGLLVTLALLAIAGLVSATRGAAGLPLSGVVSALLDALPGVTVDSGLTTSHEAILWSIRLPRMVLSMLVGAALGMAGAAYQGVFRNPLADPYLLGVSAGAGLGAVLALGFDLDLGFGPFTAVPAAAFIGALSAVAGSTRPWSPADRSHRPPPCCCPAWRWRRSSQRARPTRCSSSTRPGRERR